MMAGMPAVMTAGMNAMPGAHVPGVHLALATAQQNACDRE
jgi:hypothetical protein